MLVKEQATLLAIYIATTIIQFVWYFEYQTQTAITNTLFIIRQVFWFITLILVNVGSSKKVFRHSYNKNAFSYYTAAKVTLIIPIVLSATIPFCEFVKLPNTKSWSDIVDTIGNLSQVLIDSAVFVVSAVAGIKLGAFWIRPKCECLASNLLSMSDMLIMFSSKFSVLTLIIIQLAAIISPIIPLAFVLWHLCIFTKRRAVIIIIELSVIIAVFISITLSSVDNAIIDMIYDISADYFIEMILMPSINAVPILEFVAYVIWITSRQYTNTPIEVDIFENLHIAEVPGDSEDIEMNNFDNLYEDPFAHIERDTDQYEQKNNDADISVRVDIISLESHSPNLYYDGVCIAVV